MRRRLLVAGTVLVAGGCQALAGLDCVDVPPIAMEAGADLDGGTDAGTQCGTHAGVAGPCDEPGGFDNQTSHVISKFGVVINPPYDALVGDRFPLSFRG